MYIKSKRSTSSKAQIVFVKQQHEHDWANGYGSVELPYALTHKYPDADKELSWQFGFPSDRSSTDPRSGITRRHHLDTSGLQRPVKTAAKLANILYKLISHSSPSWRSRRVSMPGGGVEV